jgi:hypothetical protein
MSVWDIKDVLIEGCQGCQVLEHLPTRVRGEYSLKKFNPLDQTSSKDEENGNKHAPQLTSHKWRTYKTLNKEKAWKEKIKDRAGGD